MKKIFSVLLVCAIAGTAMAVPAKRGGFVSTAADGTEKTVFLNGDETFHYITDAEGNWLDEETLMPLTQEVKAARQEHGNARQLARRAKRLTGVERLLAPRGAVILVSYKDKEFKSTNADMTQWAMGDTYTYNGATGSIHQYFLDQSWGQYDLQIDVYGPVTVSKNLAYYGENDNSGYDKHPDELVKEACQLAAAQGADFSKYDYNNDGKVDWVVIIYAGYGEASNAPANTIWPHQYDLSYTNMDFELNGKTVDHYCCLNELVGTSGSKRDGIGTFCHEFSHVMGLPDFYETNEESLGLHTLVDWDIMDYGPYNNNGNTPPAYSAYERWFMGWMTPTLINKAAHVTLPELNGSQAAGYITENGSSISNILNPNPTTFYLLENRQQSGWDKYLPGHGMLITKVRFKSSYWTNNEVNNRSNYMGVDILEAQSNTGDWGETTDAYPAGANSFTSVTNYKVTNIAEANKVITFDVNGGGEEMVLSIEDINLDVAAPTKVLHEGNVYIIRNGKLYDLNGRTVK